MIAVDLTSFRFGAVGGGNALIPTGQRVTTFANLPAAGDHNGEIWFVSTQTGIWALGTRKQSGFYESDGASWTLANDPLQYFVDDQLVFKDNGDNTKQMTFELSGIGTGQTRVLTPFDESYKIGQVHEVQAGANITVDNTDPSRPIVSTTAAEGSTIDESTGVLTGGVLVTGAGATEYSITDGTGQTVAKDGTKVGITWSGLSNITPTNIVSQNITFVGIEDGGGGVGVVVESSTNFTPTQRKTIIALGVAVHVDRVNVDTTNNEQQTAYNTGSTAYSLMESLGFFNIKGNVFSPNGPNLKVDKSLGLIFKAGSNYDVNENDEHRRTLALLVALTFQYRFSDGSNGVTGDLIDPTTLDDGSGGTIAISTSNKWSVQRIYSFTSNNVKIQRGRAEYGTADRAIAGINSEDYTTEPSIKANGLLRGWLVVRKDATDLTDLAKSIFIAAPKFGESGAGSGSGNASVSVQEHCQVFWNSSPTDTVIALANTPVKVAGTSAINLKSSGMDDDGGTSNRIKNISGETKRLDVSADISAVKVGGGSNPFTFYIAIDGVVVTDSAAKQEFTSAEANISVKWYVDVPDESYAEVFVENNQGNSDITVENFQFQVSEILS